MINEDVTFLTSRYDVIPVYLTYALGAVSL